jgi:hypothetical protein
LLFLIYFLLVIKNEEVVLEVLFEIKYLGNMLEEILNLPVLL